jgi:hypothetical protein
MKLQPTGDRPMILNPDQPLYVHTLGRAFRVTALFQSPDVANGFMEANPGQGVLACYGPLICLALVSDAGFTIKN